MHKRKPNLKKKILIHVDLRKFHQTITHDLTATQQTRTKIKRNKNLYTKKIKLMYTRTIQIEKPSIICVDLRHPYIQTQWLPFSLSMLKSKAVFFDFLQAFG
ncbi:hypothetical protein CIPAW_02G096600 [Carya illinoinensis]|uniref:Uncharacterized protein n=1 Tax=Carya illinoinensis TaxID=32201 RepID=A0A8T1RC96_CARIL|nr:hypothetical protein CIPAW_02G096600 [Carya illinoinensis]